MYAARRATRLALVCLALVVALSPAFATRAVAATANDRVVLVLYWLNGCPHCEAEWRFLRTLQAEHPELVIEDHELHDNAAQRDFAAAGERLGFEAQSVPTTIIGNRVWIGFAGSVESDIRAAVEAGAAGVAGAGNATGGTSHVVSVPGFGDVDMDKTSLVVATVLIGFVDGINPCSLWVLSILLGLVLHTGSRRRVLAVGTTFLVVTATLYGLYMVGAYSFITYASYITWIERGVAVIAGVFGLINIKDYFWYRRGPSLSIADSRKPRIYRQARAVAQSSSSLPGVLGATAVMAVGVSLVETPCTAGFPVIWTDLLAANHTAFATAAALFALYMLVFLVDELAVFAVAVTTMRSMKLQEHHGRGLKLTAGVVMLTLAVTMATNPDALTTLTGTVTVFAVAGSVIAAILLGSRGFAALRHNSKAS